MKIKTLFAATAIGAMSTTAIAQNVTTPTGDIVMIEKNIGPSLAGSTPASSAGSLALMGLTAEESAILILFLLGAGAAAANSGSGTGT